MSVSEQRYKAVHAVLAAVRR